MVCFISYRGGNSFSKGQNIIAWSLFSPALHPPLETIFAFKPIFGGGYWLLSDQRNTHCKKNKIVKNGKKSNSYR